MIKAKIGDYDVYESGSLINPKSSLIEIALGTNYQFIVEFQFIKDPKNIETRVEAYTLLNDRIGLGIKFFNFNNTFGLGNIDQIKVGWLEGRSLFLNYRIYSINNQEGIIIDYTWLLGKNVDKDGNEIE